MITDVSETFDDRWETFTDEWGSRLGEALEQDGYGTYSELDEDLTTVQLEADTDGNRSWKFRSSSSDWGMIFKDGWWRHIDDLDREIYSRPDDRNDVRIGFHHRLGRNQDLAIGDRTLRVCFRNMGANDKEFSSAFVEEFSRRQSEIEAVLPASADVTGYKRNMIAATYDITADSSEAFFDAYIDALEQAFVDLVVDNMELVGLLDEVYAESVEEVYGVSNHPH